MNEIFWISLSSLDFLGLNNMNEVFCCKSAVYREVNPLVVDYIMFVISNSLFDHIHVSRTWISCCCWCLVKEFKFKYVIHGWWFSNLLLCVWKMSKLTHPPAFSLSLISSHPYPTNHPMYTCMHYQKKTGLLIFLSKPNEYIEVFTAVISYCFNLTDLILPVQLRESGVLKKHSNLLCLMAHMVQVTVAQQ